MSSERSDQGTASSNSRVRSIKTEEAKDLFSQKWRKIEGDVTEGAVLPHNKQQDQTSCKSAKLQL